MLARRTDHQPIDHRDGGRRRTKSGLSCTPCVEPGATLSRSAITSSRRPSIFRSPIFTSRPPSPHSRPRRWPWALSTSNPVPSPQLLPCGSTRLPLSRRARSRSAPALPPGSAERRSGPLKLSAVVDRRLQCLGRAANQPLRGDHLESADHGSVAGRRGEPGQDRIAGERLGRDLVGGKFREPLSVEVAGASIRAYTGSPNSTVSARYRWDGSRPVVAVISAASRSMMMPSLSVVQRGRRAARRTLPHFLPLQSRANHPTGHRQTI